jgi:hypothetical protein
MQPWLHPFCLHLLPYKGVSQTCFYSHLREPPLRVLLTTPKPSIIQPMIFAISLCYNMVLPYYTMKVQKVSTRAKNYLDVLSISFWCILSSCTFKDFVATPLWVKCEDETHTPKSGNLESFGTPENSKLEFRDQSIFHWGVLYTIGKVFKCRCPKWPRMSHLDICSPSYGLKEGSRVKLAIWLPTTKSRELTRIWRLQKECDMVLESSQRELQDYFRPHPNLRSEQEVMDAQSPGRPNRDNFGTPPWESREKVPFGCSLRRELQRIL